MGNRRTSTVGAGNVGVSTATAVGVEDDDGFVAAAATKPRGKSGDKLSTNENEEFEMREGDNFESFMKREIVEKKLKNPAWVKQLFDETMKEIEDEERNKRDVKLMKISDIKIELQSLGVSTRAFVEKDELVDALVLARNADSSQQQHEVEPDPSGDLIFQLLKDLNIGDPLLLGCLHGADNVLGLNFPRVNIFITEFQMKLRRVLGDMLNKVVSDGHCVCPTWNEIMPSNIHPDYKNKSACDMMVACLVCIGTNYIRTLPPCFHSYYAGFIAQTILFIEATSTGTPEAVDGLEYNSKLRDMWDDKDRIVTFFHKRNGCSCVNEIYVQQKAQPKMSACRHCQKHFERKKIMLCTQCKYFQYCRTECQLANWPCHRDWCKKHKIHG